MTYRELRDLINELEIDQLDADAVVFDGNIVENIPAIGLSKNPSEYYGAADDSQPILQIEH